MKRGFTLIELMIVVAIIAIIAAIAIPGLLAAQKAANERNASASLKTLITAEADFRANDRDGNHRLDYWTGDVYGLYGLRPVRGTTTALPGSTTSAAEAIRLIEPALAGADGSYSSDTALYSYVEVGSTIVSFSPKSSYFYRSFANVETTPGTTVTIRNDTDGGTGGLPLYGSVHDFGHFAFGAFPIAFRTSIHIFIVNEEATIWRIPVVPAYIATFSGGLTSSAFVTGVGVQTNTAYLEADPIVYPQAPPIMGFAKMD